MRHVTIEEDEQSKAAVNEHKLHCLHGYHFPAHFERMSTASGANKDIPLHVQREAKRSLRYHRPGSKTNKGQLICVPG